MLRVKRKSWHYRLWRLGRQHSSEPVDLCRYFWHIMLIKILIPVTLVVGFLIGVGALIWVISEHPVDTAEIVLICLGAGVALLVFVKVGEKLWEGHQERADELRVGTRTKKQPGLLRQMIKARKRAVCPLIQVVDE